VASADKVSFILSPIARSSTPQTAAFGMQEQDKTAAAVPEAGAVRAPDADAGAVRPEGTGSR
jgi:hypothetical protein